MNPRTLLFALLAVAFVIGGCNKIKSLADVSFDADFDVELDVVVPPGSHSPEMSATFASTTTIDPLSDSTVEKYIAKIKRWEITGMSGKIVRVSKAGTSIQNAEMQVYTDNFNAAWNLPDIPLVQGRTFPLDNGGGQWFAVENILGEKKVFTVAAEGATDDDDFSFTIRIYVKCKVTANPL
ncbi:MAG: hypothetical protein L3J66_00355 [Bacteroidales bacterium]|nr:hypothetical protein [Bacteroidales bacterium]